MNSLIQLNGPQLKFVIPEHKEDFIKNVVDLYNMEVQGLAVSKRWLPHIFNIGMEMENKFIVGGIVTRRSRDPHLYMRDEANIPPPLINHWALTMKKELVNFYKDIDIDFQMLNNDLEKVLNYYHMSYLEDKSVLVNGKWTNFWLVYNAPIVKVW